MDWEYPITSDLSDVEEKDIEGERVAVGFRPSGELHVGNLLTVTYAAVIADELDLDLDLMCCDTDWSAHIHENHRPENSQVMKLFFERDCPCGGHGNVAEHRMDEIAPFLDALEEELDIEIERNYLSKYRDGEYLDALREILGNMEEFDRIFGGGFRRRYRSPVVNVCSCGFSHAKGAAYSERTDELVFACRNGECGEGFAASELSGDIGVYYLVDPVRDPSRDVAVHVFGGDYRDAEKEQKTPKIAKVARITELATGETPDYFLTPMIADEEGKPLSKSKGTGATVSDIRDLEEKAVDMAGSVRSMLEEDRRYVSEEDL
ncbi:MAG: hypothetical protein ABEK01_00570 [Candidatus Nanohaloarchaea archaeon]